MKPTDKPELSEDWWDDARPEDLKACDLDDLLPEVEEALAEQRRNSEDPDAIDECLSLLQDVPSAAAKAAKQCDKQKDKVLIAVLGKYGAVVKEESSRLEKLKNQLGKKQSEDDDNDADDDEKGVLKEEYRDRMIKQLRAGKEVQFCFGLNKSDPTQSKLVLCNKRKPERLHKILKQTGGFSERLMTYGTATGDGKILQFRLADDAKEPSQIIKLAKEYLKSDRSLKFKKLRVLAGGQTFEQNMADA